MSVGKATLYLEIMVVAIHVKLLHGKNVIVDSPEALHGGERSNALLLTSPLGLLPTHHKFSPNHIRNLLRTAFVPQSPGTVQLVLHNDGWTDRQTFSAGIFGNESTTLNNPLT